MGAVSSDQFSRNKGCFGSFLLLGLLAMGFGIHLMANWARLGGGGRAGAVVLVMIGTLMLLPLILFIGFVLAVRVAVGRAIKKVGEATRGFSDRHQAMYSQIHEFRPAKESDFADIDRSYYDAASNELQQAGLGHLGDVVDLTIETSAGLHTPIRIFTSVDGSTTAAVYHISSGGLKICDLMTEFTDHTFVVTTNTGDADKTNPVFGIERRKFPLGTPIGELLEAHERERQKLLAAKGAEVQPVRIQTIDDAIASEKRQQGLKNFAKQQFVVDTEGNFRSGNELAENG